MKKILKRIIIILPAVLMQILYHVLLTSWLVRYEAAISILLMIFAFIFVLYMLLSDEEGSYKLLWMMVILLMPIPGALLYLFFGNQKTGKPLKKKIDAISINIHDQSHLNDIEDVRMKQTLSVVEKETGYTLQPASAIKYYPVGEDLWKDLLVDLKNAKVCIYMEYFIVQHGLMLDKMIDILEEKVNEGIPVYFMYDDLGSLSTFSKKECRNLEKKGFHVLRFNAMKRIKGTLNYRSHRKMTIIDHEIVYSGGINLADEYINEKERFGHWKDIGFKTTGHTVKQYESMFIRFWNAFSKQKIEMEERQYSAAGEGYVLSYYDSPVEKRVTSHDFYIELLNQATKYVYFYTPYLILSDTMTNALCKAAKRGVDIRIYTPGIPDKKLVFKMTQSFYPLLLEAGVKIYEYTPGFLHAKACVMDDQLCTIGTVNLDYRSLFLHFENNTIFYQTAMTQEVKDDMMRLQEQSHAMTLDEMNLTLMKWIGYGILRIFAPLC